jgi:putative (di)nucleoside polyphosphate hydrolase
VNLETHHPEFEDWRWIEPERLPELVVSFKRAVYEAVIEEFRPIIESLRTD